MDERVAPAGGIRYRGKTYRAGDRMPQRYYKAAEQRLRDPAAGSAFFPPNMGRTILPHVVTFSGMTGSLSRVYAPSDEALRHSMDNAHMMLSDPTITGPLHARQMMTALLNWSVESEDDKDPILKGAADELATILRRTPRFTEYKRWLGEGIWYGRSAVQNQYAVWHGRDGKNRIVIGGWKPVSGDKLLFRFDDGSGRYEDGQLGVRVSRGNLHDDAIAGPYELEPTAQGMAYFLKAWERSKFAVHKHMIRDGEYEDINSGGSIHGVGLRSFLYWVWYQKQETMLQMVTLIERTGNGFTIYYYPEGNSRAKDEIDDVARSQGHTNVIKLPHSAGDPDAYRIETIPANTAGLDALSDLIDNYFGDLITRFILGQTLSTKAAATGLGSGVADLHKESLADIVRYDAVNMEETLTKEVLQPLRDYNLPKLRTVEFRVRLSTDADAPEAMLAKIKQAWDMGAKIKATDIMDRIGLTVPKSDEPSIYNPQIVGAVQQLENPAPPPMPGMPPGDPGNPMGGAGSAQGPDGPPNAGPGAPGGDGGPGGPGDPQPNSMDAAGNDVSKLYGPILYRREKLRYRRNDKLRAAIAAAVEATHREPSEAQIDAGNAPKGKFWWGGWQVAIENPKGSTRKGWKIPLAAHYGYIRRTVSEADGDHLDCYIGPTPESEIVYVIDQVTAGGRFDEHKAMIGFPSRREAVQAYLDCYPSTWKLGKVTPLTVWQFRAWLTAGDTGKPLAKQVHRYSQRHAPAGGTGEYAGGEFLPADASDAPHEAESEPAPGDRPARKGDKPARRAESILRDAASIEFTDAPAGDSRQEIGSRDYDAIERWMSSEQRAEYEEAMEQARSEAIDDYLNNHNDDFEEDMSEAISEAGYSQAGIERFATRSTQNPGLHGLINEWWNDTDDDGPEALDGLIEKLDSEWNDWEDSNEEDYKALAAKLADFRDRADDDIQAELDNQREDHEKSLREAVEYDYDDSRDRMSYLRDFFNEHEDEINAGEAEPGKWYRDPTGGHIFHFETSSGRQFRISAFDTSGYRSVLGGAADEVTTVEFADDRNKFDMTGKGEAFEVFTNVVPAVVRYIDAADPPVLHFSAKGESRQRLYERLVKTVLSASPGRVAATMEDGKELHFAIVKADNAKALKAMQIYGRPLNYAKGSTPPPKWTPIEPATDPAWWTQEGWQEFEGAEPDQDDDKSDDDAPQQYAKRSKGTPAAGSFNFDEEKHPRQDDGKFAPKGEGEVKHGRAEQVDGKDFLTDKPEPPGHKKGDFTPTEKKKQTGFLLGQYDDPDQGLLFGDASKPEVAPEEPPSEPKETTKPQFGDLVRTADGQEGVMRGHPGGQMGNDRVSVQHANGSRTYHDADSLTHVRKLTADEQASYASTGEAGAAEGPIGLADRLEAEHAGLKLEIYDKTRRGTDKVWELSKIIVPKEERGQGKGTAIMQQITAAADAAGATLVLDPSTDYGATSKARLEKFYAGHGFKPNKGRTADLAITGAMIRRPKEAKAEPKADEPKADEPKATPAAGTASVAGLLDFRKRLNAGEVTPEEFRETFERHASAEGRAAFIADAQSRWNAQQLKAVAGRMGDFRASTNTKAENAKSVWKSLLINNFHLKDGAFSYSMGIGTGEKMDAEGAMLTALRKHVDETTQEHLDKHKAGVDEREAGRQEKAKTEEKASANPETLAEFKIRATTNGGYKTLTSEQKAKFDELAAEESRSASKAATPTKVEAIQGEHSGFEVTKGFHAKRGHDIWTVSPKARVEREVFDEMNTKAKQLGGWYYKAFGGTPGGFHFKTEEAAQKFTALQEGDIDRSAELQAKGAEKADRTGGKLAEVADALEARGHEVLGQDRKTNTARRADMAANVEARAQADIARARTIRAIGDALAKGETKFLDGISAGTHVETLDAILRRAQRKAIKHDIAAEKYGGDASKVSYGEEEKERGRSYKTTDADHAEYPYPSVHKTTLRDALDALKGKRGLKYDLQTLRDRLDGLRPEDMVVRVERAHEWQAMKNIVSALKEGRAGQQSRLVNNLDDDSAEFRRLQAAGIHNEHELRAALREYVPLRGKLPEADPVKKAERALIGKKIEGFFPTPAPLISRMLDAAEIKDTHHVLEPSAGKGDILDAVHERHPGATTHGIERNQTLREVLDAKGHDVEYGDFLEHNNAAYDRIVMNPPFENGQDREHVRHAYNLLKPGGRIVAIMSEGPFSRSHRADQEFRDWLEQQGGTSEKLEGAFAGSDAFRQTGVSTRLVVLDKPDIQRYGKRLADWYMYQSDAARAARRPPLRYAQRHAPAGGVTIGGKQFTGGQFIPDGDYAAADPSAKAAIDQANPQTNDFQTRGENRLDALDAGHTIKGPTIGEWTKQPGGAWLSASGRRTGSGGLYRERNAPKEIDAHLDAHFKPQATEPQASEKPAEPAPSQPEAGGTAEPTAEQRQHAKEALWSQGEIDRTQKMLDALKAQGANQGNSPHAKEYARRLNELRDHTKDYNEHVQAAGATSPEHLQELAGKKPAAPAAQPPAAPPAEPAPAPQVTAPPDPNAGSQDIAGLLAAAPAKTKVGKWTKGEGDKWIHEHGSVFNTAQMIGDSVKRGEGDAINQAVTSLQNPTTAGAGQPKTSKGSKSPAPAARTAPKGRIDPARMSTHDRANLSTVASMFGINPGDAKNADRAANFALLAARKLGLDPQGADKTEQAASATKYLAAQKPKLDALIDTAAKLGYKGKAQTLVHRYRAAGEHIVKAATAAGYQGSGKYDRDDIMGALSHLSTVKAASVQQPDAGPLPLPPGPGGVKPGQPGQTLAERRAAAKATPGATARPPSKFTPKPNGDDANPTISQIIDALSAKVGGKMQLAAVVGVMAALWAAFAHQQRRQFFRQANASGYNVLRYEE